MQAIVCLLLPAPGVTALAGLLLRSLRIRRNWTVREPRFRRIVEETARGQEGCILRVPRENVPLMHPQAKTAGLVVRQQGASEIQHVHRLLARGQYPQPGRYLQDARC